MSRKIYYLIGLSVALILNGFGVFFVSAKFTLGGAQAARAESIIKNTIVVETNTGNTSENDLDGAAGVDGNDGADGANGSNGSSVKTGTAEASVKVINKIGGEEIPSATIDIQTSSTTGAVIEKKQVITSADGKTVVENNISVHASAGSESSVPSLEPSESGEAGATATTSADALDSQEAQAEETHGYVGIVVGVVISVLKNVVSAVSALLKLL